MARERWNIDHPTIAAAMVRMILAFYDEEKETCAGWGGCGAEMWTSRQPPSSFKAEDVPKMALELSDS
jgi:hypothetical protein